MVQTEGVKALDKKTTQNKHEKHEYKKNGCFIVRSLFDLVLLDGWCYTVLNNHSIKSILSSPSTQQR